MLDKIIKNYFLLIFTFLTFYFLFNLLDGERGLFSFFKKKEILIMSQNEETNLTSKIEDFRFFKNSKTHQITHESTILTPDSSPARRADTFRGVCHFLRFDF